MGAKDMKGPIWADFWNGFSLYPKIVTLSTSSSIFKTLEVHQLRKYP